MKGFKEYADDKHDRVRAMRVFRSYVKDGLTPDYDVIESTNEADYVRRKSDKLRMKADIIKNLYL